MKSQLAHSFNTATKQYTKFTYKRVKKTTRSSSVMLLLLLFLEREWSGYCCCRLAISFIRYGALVRHVFRNRYPKYKKKD